MNTKLDSFIELNYANILLNLTEVVADLQNMRLQRFVNDNNQIEQY